MCVFSPLQRWVFLFYVLTCEATFCRLTLVFVATWAFARLVACGLSLHYANLLWMCKQLFPFNAIRGLYRLLKTDRHYTADVGVCDALQYFFYTVVFLTIPSSIFVYFLFPRTGLCCPSTGSQQWLTPLWGLDLGPCPSLAWPWGQQTLVVSCTVFAAITQMNSSILILDMFGRRKRLFQVG